MTSGVGLDIKILGVRDGGELLFSCGPLYVPCVVAVGLDWREMPCPDVLGEESMAEVAAAAKAAGYDWRPTIVEDVYGNPSSELRLRL